ncbi:testis-expressed protein 264 homolog [Halichondria panicea]|uniref:testis-expressed protein 264 homolog n=1 Tax=Halichondria panicea TaxID=6063 RepID=UPI00312B43A6
MGVLFYVVLLLAVVLALLLVALLHAGFFYELRIRISTPLSCPKRVAYRLYTGPYKNCGGYFKQLISLVPDLKTFGVYYDDPDKVPQDKLRYIVGCCLSNDRSSGDEESLKSKGYSIWTFPTCTNAVITEFPWRSMLSLYVAPFCVYPPLKKYLGNLKSSCPGPILEVYEIDCIRYIAPLENNEGFFVPEVPMETETKKDQ